MPRSLDRLETERLDVSQTARNQVSDGDVPLVIIYTKIMVIQQARANCMGQ